MTSFVVFFKAQRERDRQRQRDRDRERDRQTDRETETDRDRDRQTETERDRERSSPERCLFLPYVSLFQAVDCVKFSGCIFSGVMFHVFYSHDSLALP